MLSRLSSLQSSRLISLQSLRVSSHQSSSLLNYQSKDSYVIKVKDSQIVKVPDSQATEHVSKLSEQTLNSHRSVADFYSSFKLGAMDIDLLLQVSINCDVSLFLQVEGNGHMPLLYDKMRSSSFKLIAMAT